MFRIGYSIFGVAMLGVLTLVSAAFAGQPVTQTLTPPPPSFETCKVAGNQTICDGARIESYGPDDTGIACGSGASAFDVLDTATFKQHAIRYYNEAGNLTRRVIYNTYTSAQFSNPLTGATVPYAQQSIEKSILAVPGDLDSATDTYTGQVSFTVAHMGVVLLDAGKEVDGPDGTIEFKAGPDDFLDFYVDGDTSVVQKLCSALGAE
jgi:hypothetical protein